MNNDKTKCCSNSCMVKDTCARYDYKSTDTNLYINNFQILCNESNDYNFKEDKELNKTKRFWERG